jgi:mannose-1-phosphate guanylyltransferase
MHALPLQRKTREGEEAFWAVIPAGGAGTRLWPLSRSTRPKFLLPLLGNRSLLQQTFDRLLGLTDAERILVVCGPDHVASIARQLPDLPSANIIVEPTPKGTGPALALASALIARRDSTAIMGSFAADHVVTNPDRFERAVQTAIEAARRGDLVTIGIAPTRPDTGYGYIERSDTVLVESPTGSAYRAARFVEKPDQVRTKAYLDAGTFLWNAAMFTWRVDIFLDELLRLQPEIFEGVQAIANAWDTQSREHVMASTWSSLPQVTIDHGVMELAARVAVVPAEMGWSDVGDWNGLGELIEQDGLGNSVRGDLVQIDTTNSVIWSETGRMVATVGLDNIVVVDTDDALLVIDRNKSQEVRQVVERLKTETRTDLS